MLCMVPAPFLWAQANLADCAYDVLDYGARADSTYDSQEAVQAAIDQCAEAGGGVVCFPTGHYLAADIHLRDNVHLRFDGGSSLAGQIHIEGVRNVAIIGMPGDRVRLGQISMLDSRDLTFKHLFSRFGWVLRHCQGVHVDDVKIEQAMQRQANGVAITFVDSKDALVTNSELTCNDDAFCLKRSAENIHIRNSILCGRQAASYKIGTETDGIFRNLSMTNCIIYNSNRAGINIEAVDGADIDGVRISGIKMYNVASPFYIRLGNRDRYAKGIGSIRNVDISDVHFVGMQHDEGISSSIQGLPDHPVENVTIRDVHITTHGGGEKGLARRQVPERSNFYPEYDIYGQFPAYGFYCRYVDGLRLINVNLHFAEPDLRSAVVCQSVDDLEINGLNAQYWIPRNQYTAPFVNSEPTIRLEDVRDAFLHNMDAPIGSPLVAVFGENSGHITFSELNASLSQVPPVSIGPEVQGWMNPEPEAALSIVDLSLAEVRAGEVFSVEGTLENRGPAGYGKLELYLDDTLAARKWRWFAQGATEKVSWELPPLFDTGSHTLRAGSRQLTFTPKASDPALRTLSLQVPSLAEAGKIFPVEAIVQNTGSAACSETVELTQDGRTLARQRTQLAPGGRTTLRFEHQIQRPGRYEMRIGDQTAAVSVNPIWIDANRNGSWERGEASFAGFTDALRAAEAGDLLLVNPGHFRVDSVDLPLRITQPGLTIRSVEGAEATRIEALDADEEQYEQHALFFVAADNVTIEGFTLSRAVYNVYVEEAANTAIRNNFFNVSRRYHIYMVGAKNVEIAENRSRVGRYNFLTMQTSTGCTVRDNYHYEDPCGYMVVESHNNTFLRNHFDSLSWYGITLNNANGNRIEDNLFAGGRILGFQCRQGCEGNEIVRNTFLGNRTEAILLTADSKGNIISQNNILGNRGLAVTNETHHAMDATENWWGSPSGPGGAGSGSGDTVDERVRYEPWLKAPVDNSWSEQLEKLYKPK